MSFNRLLISLFLIIVLVGCSTPQPTTDVAAIYTSAYFTALAKLPSGTNTPLPSTNTPIPTYTPLTPTPIPSPILISGKGDAVEDISNPFDVAIAHIQGNSCNSYFGVQSYGSDGAKIDLLVNTTEQYDGVRSLDFKQGQHTTRFEVKASCAWQISVMPLASSDVMSVSETKSGKGDNVIRLLSLGQTPDLAKIKGNSNSGYFGVFGYGKSEDLLVNTTEPYDGTVILSPDIIVFEVISTGDWSITVMTK